MFNYSSGWLSNRLLVSATCVQSQNRRESTRDLETCGVCGQTADHIIARSPWFFFIPFSFPPIKVSSTREVQQISGFFGAALYVQFEEPESVLVMRVYSELFCGCSWLRATLKTNQTTSARVDLFFSSLPERLGLHMLSRQTAAPEVSDRPVCWCDCLPTEQSVSPPAPLCFSIWSVCSLFLSTFWTAEKIFLSGHQWINGDVFTCQWPPPPPRPLHDNGTFNSSLTECFSLPATCRSLGSAGRWLHF